MLMRDFFCDFSAKAQKPQIYFVTLIPDVILTSY